MKNDISKKLFKRASDCIPGGVSSPVRAWNAVGGNPLFIKKGEGPFVYDADGNRFIDYLSSWGPVILGHAHCDVIKAAENAIKKGTSFGAPTETELELCELIVQSVPSVEKVRLVNSGTEAVMSAIRLARAFTGRKKIIKFEGCYHGHWDPLLVKAGSGLATNCLSSSAGVPEEMVKDTIVLSYNSISDVEKAFKKNGSKIACIIVEPVAGNMGTVLPVEDFLDCLRMVTEKYGSLLIFDEVITGFRIGLSGAQGRFDIGPDITCFGKIIGGGLPVGAYGGRKEIMDLISPSGEVYQAGTLSGNPVASACGVAVLKVLAEKSVYSLLEKRTESLCCAIEEIAEHFGISIVINRVASMFSIFFTGEKKIEKYHSVCRCNEEVFINFFNTAISRGLYLPPSRFETSFLSLAHDDSVIDETINAFEVVFERLKN